VDHADKPNSMATVDVGRVQHLGSPGEEEENTLENVTKRVRKLREREKKKKKVKALISRGVTDPNSIAPVLVKST